MTAKFKQFQSEFPELTTALNFYTEDCETVTFIDTDSNRVEFTRSVTASCGCCGEYEQYDDDLDNFIEGLSETDFQELLIELKQK
jgi:hypothetical protein